MIKRKRKVVFYKNKRFLIYSILVLFLMIGMGYSVLNAELNINGDVTVKKYTPRFSLYNVLKDAAEEGTYAMTYSGNHQDTLSGPGSENIYYWHGTTTSQGTQILDKNNVIFGGYCWQMVRTTDTGGVKMIYNGKAVNNQCLNTRGNQIGYNLASIQSLNSAYWYGTDYTYNSNNQQFSISGTTEQATWNDTTAPNLIGKYTCMSANANGTCSSIYYVESYYNSEGAVVIPIDTNTGYPLIGRVQYNFRDNSSTYADYMSGDVYPFHNLREQEEKFTDYEPVNNTMRIGTSITDNGNGTYTVNGSTSVTTTTWSRNYANYVHRYTCGNTSTTCSSPFYIIATIAEGFDYVRSGEKILIAQGRNGMQLTNTLLVRHDEWAQNYNTYSNYKFTCNTTSATCTEDTLRMIFAFKETSYTYAYNRYYGSSVTWDGTKYTLVDPIGVENYENFTNLSTHHYTCMDAGAKTCTEVAYIHEYCVDETNNRAGYGMKYITFSGGMSDPIQALSDMHTKNTNNSTIKSAIEAWYQKNLLPYDNYLEDTIYCNERTISNYYGWNPNGGSVLNRLIFKDYNITNDLYCANSTDRFSVSNNQAPLAYKIGLMTASEANLVNLSNVRVSTHWYWLNSPNIMHWITPFVNAVDNDGSISYAAAADQDAEGCGVRPMISLNSNAQYTLGDGSMANPYIVITE